MLRNLNIYESPGSDCTSPRILRECAQVLSSPLTLFLNTSFSQGQPPSLQFTRKGAKILWRTTAKYHYRMQQKLRESVVRTRVVDFWSDLNLFNLNQFAYLRGKSTLAQLLTCYNDWAKARNRSQQTDIIFLDLSEAFDSMPHERFIVAETTTAWDRWLPITVD